MRLTARLQPRKRFPCVFIRVFVRGYQCVKLKPPFILCDLLLGWKCLLLNSWMHASVTRCKAPRRGKAPPPLSTDLRALVTPSRDYRCTILPVPAHHTKSSRAAWGPSAFCFLEAFTYNKCDIVILPHILTTVKCDIVV